MSLLGIVGIYIAFGGDPFETPFMIVGYGFGASFVALFGPMLGNSWTSTPIP